MNRPEADKAAHELKQLAQPKSVFGFFQRLANSLDKFGSDFSSGSHAAVMVINAGKPLTQQEVTHPLANELEQTIAAAVAKMLEVNS